MAVTLTNDEAKMLTMVLVEDRSKVVTLIRADLAPHGKRVLSMLIEKLASEVLGVDPND